MPDTVAEPPVVVWSGKRGLYWMVEGYAYTHHLHRAARFRRAEAQALVDRYADEGAEIIDLAAATAMALRRAREERDPLAFWMLRAANTARQGEWGDGRPPLSPTFRATELAGELGEALNVVKKLERERLGVPGSRATVEDLAAELADVAICLDLLAMEFGVDLAAARAAKFDATSAEMGFATRLGEGRIADDHNGGP